MDVSRKLDEVNALLDIAKSPELVAFLRQRKRAFEDIVFNTPSTPAERPDSPTWDRLRRAALKRDRYTCQGCGRIDVRLTVHHVIAVKDGGQTILCNLKTLCDDCHGQIHPWLEEDHENSDAAASVGVPRR